jgi:hypothetical protein
MKCQTQWPESGKNTYLRRWCKYVGSEYEKKETAAKNTED